jgi:hypothetical protein
VLTNETFELPSPGTQDVSKINRHLRILWTGDTFWQDSYGENPGEHRFAALTKNKERLSEILPTVSGSPAFGLFPGDRDSVYSILKTASKLTVRPETEEIAGSRCYVLDAVTANGRYSLWLDPEHGYGIAKAQVLKSGSDIGFGRPLNKHVVSEGPAEVKTTAEQPTGLQEFTFTMDRVVFAKINDTWIPEAYSYATQLRYSNGRTISEHKTYKRTLIDPHPDFDAMGAFKIDLPEGTEVFVEEAAGIIYRWHDGKPIPELDNDAIRNIDNAVQALQETTTQKTPRAVEGLRATTRDEGQSAAAIPSGIPSYAWLVAVVVVTAVAIISVVIGRRMRRHHE